MLDFDFHFEEISKTATSEPHRSAIAQCKEYARYVEVDQAAFMPRTKSAKLSKAGKLKRQKELQELQEAAKIVSAPAAKSRQRQANPEPFASAAKSAAKQNQLAPGSAAAKQKQLAPVASAAKQKQKQLAPVASAAKQKQKPAAAPANDHKVSSVRGVDWDAKDKKWRARITVNGTVFTGVWAACCVRLLVVLLWRDFLAANSFVAKRIA